MSDDEPLFDLFGDDDAPVEQDNPPPPAELKRQASLSKNGLMLLERRLKELNERIISNRENCDKRVAQLRAEIAREELRVKQEEQDLEEERTAIEAGIRKARAARARLTEDELEEAEEAACCGVCMENPRDALVAPCGHVAMCFDCANSVVNSKQPYCPWCRAQVTSAFRAFLI